MLTPKSRSNGEKKEERVIDKWGKGRGRSRKREIGHGWVMWIGAYGGGIGALGCGLISPVLGCWCAISVVFGWTEHSSSCEGDEDGDLTGAIVGSMALSLSLFAHLWVLSLPLSLFARLQKWFEVKITTKNIWRPVALILQSTLKTFSIWPNFQ